jgi:hypothetical protein
MKMTWQNVGFKFEWLKLLNIGDFTDAVSGLGCIS